LPIRDGDRRSATTAICATVLMYSMVRSCTRASRAAWVHASVTEEAAVAFSLP
jgi:hypothetical protein